MMKRVLLTLAALALMLAPQNVYASSYLMSSDPTLSQAAIDVWFRAPGAGYGDAPPGIARLSATAAAAAKLERGLSLADFVRHVGGRLTINVYPDIVGISISVPSSAARRVVAALSAAYFQPSIDDAALKTAQRDVAMLSVSRKYLSDDILHDALFAQLFPNGAAHYPPLPDSVPDVTRISLADVQSFAKNAFRSDNATLTLAGGVDQSLLGAVAGSTGGTPDAPVRTALSNTPAANSTINGNVAGIGLAWAGPPITDERAATAMDFIADYLFRDGTGTIAKPLALSDTYVSGQFITLHDPGVMLVTIGGSNADAQRTAVVAAVNALAKPLDSATFAAAREAFLYHIAAETQLPIQQADNLGWYAAEGNADYAPSVAKSTYWAAARALDPDFVASVVRKYLSKPVVVNLTSIAPKGSSSS